MADLLGEVDANILPAPVVRAAKRNRSLERPRARVRSPVAETRGQPAAKRSRLSSDLPPTPPVVEDVVDDGFVGGMDLDDVAVPQSDPAPSSPAAKAAERKVQTATVAVKAEPEEEDDTMEVAQAAGIRTASVNISGSRPPKKLAKPDPYPSPEKSSPAKGSAPATELDASSWNDVTSRLNVVSGSPSSESCGIAKIDYKDAVEADGSVNVFWTDYAEVKGSLCLFGKVKNKRTGAFVSCFIKIDNIMRKLYFLPRPRRVRDGVETDEEVDMSDVYGEVDAIMDSMGVKMHKIKPCTRKYAFELKDIPREARYLKLLYPYTSEF